MIKAASGTVTDRQSEPQSNIRVPHLSVEAADAEGLPACANTFAAVYRPQTDTPLEDLWGLW